MTYLEIIVNVKRVKGVFHYHLPSELEDHVKIGHLVTVPFGHQTVQGIVVGVVDQPSVPETRPIQGIVDESAVLTENQIVLARKLAAISLASLADCIALMLPPGLDKRADLLYSPGKATSQNLTQTQKRILNLLEKRGPLTGRQLDRSFKRVNWRASMNSLIHKGIITKQQVLPTPKVRPKYTRMIKLDCPLDAALSALPELGRSGTKALERRQKILRFLMEQSNQIDISSIYAECGGYIQDLRFLEERHLLSIKEQEVWRDPIGHMEIKPYQAPELTSDQARVWEAIRKNIHEVTSGLPVDPILLHGVTGSGKTEIYLHAVQETLALKKRAIVLVPEIALTPQTIQRFAGRFPGEVSVLHSKLSDGERYDTWRRARQGEFGLIVGPRSALFAPLENIGLIVVDECHDDSYYQSESSPYYHAREVAVEYAKQIEAVCLLGSATPDIVSSYRAKQKRWQSLHLPARILAHREAVQAQLNQLQKHQKITSSPFKSFEGQAAITELPTVSVVDMRQELKAGNRSIFSRALQTSLKDTMERELQAILFLNRRGSATYVFCRDCGRELKCPHCDIPLTFHESRDILLCHYCNYQRKMPTHCPHCDSERIRRYGTGTQKVESVVQEMFPRARTLRWDHETTRKKGAHEHILDQFVNQKADILIGTQMLAKGLDLPLVTLVGVVLADVGLSLPDFRANERAFQVLTQVAGRAGRSPLGGEVILQTFQPEHYVIQAAAQHNYNTFFEKEISFRRHMKYPPFSKIVRLEYRHYSNTKAENAAENLAERVRKWLTEDNRGLTRIIGPSPCFFERIGGVYRWQIVLIGPDPVSLLRGRKIDDWKIEVYPPNLL